MPLFLEGGPTGFHLDPDLGLTPAICIGALQIFTLPADNSPGLVIVAANALLDCVSSQSHWLQFLVRLAVIS